jgi:presenilin-like A22 family membrane protease
MLLASTGVILLLRRFMKGRLIRWVLLGSVWVSFFSTLYSLIWVAVGDPAALISAVILSSLLVIALVKWPRWYIIDAAAILLGAVTTSVLGISLSIPVTVVLLIVLAVYDVVSVYKTKHMLSLAEAILNSGLPLMLIVPKGRKFVDGETVEIRKDSVSTGKERQGFYMGLGDIIIPSCLLISIYWGFGSAVWPVLLAILVGTLGGFSVLSFIVSKGKPQAGLPFLCGGAILAYVVSSFILYGRLIGFG